MLTAQARRIRVSTAGASRDCALVVAPCTFSDMVITFRGRRKGTLCFGGAKSTFRDGREGSERFVLRNADFVAGAALWTWW